MRKRRAARKRRTERSASVLCRIRPKAGWTGLHQADPSFTLSREVREELAEIAGLDRERGAKVVIDFVGVDGERVRITRRDVMLREVERVLSAYPSMEQVLDHGPRPVHHVAELKGVSDCAERMLALLTRTEYLSGDLALAGFNVFDMDAYVKLTAKLRKAGGLALEVARERDREMESRHGPTRRARDRISYALSHVFDFFYQGAESDAQKLKGEFIRAALGAAAIPCSPVRGGRDKRQRPSHSRLLRYLPERCRECVEARTPWETAWTEATAQGSRGPFYSWWAPHRPPKESPAAMLADLAQQRATEKRISFAKALEQVKQERKDLLAAVAADYDPRRDPEGILRDLVERERRTTARREMRELAKRRANEEGISFDEALKKIREERDKRSRPG